MFPLSSLAVWFPRDKEQHFYQSAFERSAKNKKDKLKPALA